MSKIKLTIKKKVINLDPKKLHCDIDTIASKLQNIHITTNAILEDIIAKYINHGLSLPDILKLEAPTNKTLQREISELYSHYVINNLDDIPINKQALETFSNDDTSISSISSISSTLEEDIDEPLEEIDNLTTKQKQLRETIQEQYISNSIEELTSWNRVLIKAPTGFGKTVILYKVIDILKCEITVILTPRRQLNKQTIEDKYKQYLTNPGKWDFHNFSPDSSQSVQVKKDNLKKFINESRASGKKMIILACYQESSSKLLEYFEKWHLQISLCICDEAHTIASWSYLSNDFQRTFFGVGDPSNPDDSSKVISKYIFTTATPTIEMTSRPQIWGSTIEHIQVYDLINTDILCNFDILVKQCSDKNRIPDIAKITMKTMKRYKKHKCITYCNNINNALIVYAQFKLKYPDKKIFIYVSNKSINQKTFDNFEGFPEFANVRWNKDDASIDKFKECKEPAIVITVRMLGYGFDNLFIDLIVFADARDGEAEIRQILGRGLRNNPELYPGKLLHVILPITKTELLDVAAASDAAEDSRTRLSDFNNVKRFLQFIVSECGKDIINGRIVDRVLLDKKESSDASASASAGADDDVDICAGDDSSNAEEEDSEETGKKKKLKKYEGDLIPLEICHELSTNLYGTYTRFLGFLRQKRVFDEASYNDVREAEGAPDWIPILGEVRKKFKKFCFLDIHARENAGYYETLEECERAYEIAEKKVLNDDEDALEYNAEEMTKTILAKDKKIPKNMKYYYPSMK
jgi:superfamily II DNA or RNA helicase